ncbi:MAG: WYL domain-containing transcriptional regulator [Cytophagales bacterium]|nr:MAG: WYL domain-containing transcriptional regulator [Cytophagales bacterium]
MKEIKETLIKGLKIIALLSEEGGRTMKDLATAMGMTSASVYRYKDALEQTGFELLETKPHHYKIKTRQPKYWQPTLLFTQEEVELIRGAVAETKAFAAQKTTIEDKLYLHSDLLSIPHKILQARFGKNVAEVKRAIQQKKQVRLESYHSASSNTVSNRLVEPICLLDHHRRLYAYDLKNRKIYQYKMERVGQAVVLENAFQYAHEHKKIDTDVFWTVPEGLKKVVSMELSLSAYEILREEYPRADSVIKQMPNNNRYMFRAELSDFRVISAFILKLPGEVHNIQPPALVQHLKERMKNYTF